MQFFPFQLDKYAINAWNKKKFCSIHFTFLFSIEKSLNILKISSWWLSIIIFRASVARLFKYFSVLFTIHFPLFAEGTRLPLPGKANAHSSKVINWSDAFENLNITVFVTVNNPVWGSELIAMPCIALQQLQWKPNKNMLKIEIFCLGAENFYWCHISISLIKLEQHSNLMPGGIFEIFYNSSGRGSFMWSIVWTVHSAQVSRTTIS